jgi:hypothetical protein
MDYDKQVELAETLTLSAILQDANLEQLLSQFEDHFVDGYDVAWDVIENLNLTVEV